MSDDFAKIFRHPEIGQVLFERGYDDEDEHPILAIKFWHPEVNGVASVEIGFANSDVAIRDKVFEEFTEQQAIEQVNKIIDWSSGEF